MLSKLDYSNILCRWFEMYNDPFPREDGGRGYVRDAAAHFCEAASESLLEAIYSDSWSRTCWATAAQNGWLPALNDAGNEDYYHYDGTKVTWQEKENAVQNMNGAEKTYYWR